MYSPLASFTQYHDWVSSMVLNISSLSLYIAEYYSTVQIYHILLIYSPVDRHLDCYQFGDIIKKADMHIHV